MGNNPNTIPLQTMWTRQYQLSMYTQPVFPAFATMRLEKVLSMGDTVKRTYASNVYANTMGGDGSYSPQAWTDTEETLQVTLKKEVSIQIPDWQELMMHMPLRQKYAEKAMTALWDDVDAYLLGLMQAGAGSVIDNGIITGTTSDKAGMTIDQGNVYQLFVIAEQKLIKKNVKWVPNKQFTGIPNQSAGKMAVCAISPETYGAVQLFLGSKNSALGDKVVANGYVGYFQGFNMFVSNNLPWEGQLVMDTNPTAGNTFTLLYGVTEGGVSQAFTYTFATTPATAGEVVVGSAAADTVNNLVVALNTPYTDIANTATTGYKAWTKASLTIAQVKLLNGITASNVVTATGAASASGTSLKLVITGSGTVPVVTTMTASTVNVWTTTKQITHNIFGVSDSIDLLMKSRPHMQTNPVSSKVAIDLITWNLFGAKVFRDQGVGIVDAYQTTSAFTAPDNLAF